MADPKVRFGIRYTKDPLKDRAYLQLQYDNDNDFARPGELFLNEPLEKVYYRDTTTGTFKELPSAKVLSPSVETAPLTETDPGLSGQIFWDSEYLYLCVASDVWKRIALTGWG